MIPSSDELESIFEKENSDVIASNLYVFSTKPEEKKFKCIVTGKTKKIDYSKVTEYVDKTTGELIDSDRARSLGVTEFLYPLIKAQQDAILSSLRKEVREFAEFVLRFRNRRRGVTPGVDKLCKWYSCLTGKRLDNVKRLVPKLKEYVLANNNLLLPIWQIPGKSTQAVDHVSEEFVAELLFMQMLRRARDSWKNE